ncbi:Hypothetical predicted protein, partial [Paramuricea clavata]
MSKEMKINPADAGSRGILPKDIINHDLWWSGPHWLKSDPSTWESNLPESDNFAKTLGIDYNSQQDQFRFSVSDFPTEETELTKRLILSDSAKIFDPLGLVSCVTIVVKIIFQRLWERESLKSRKVYLLSDGNMSKEMKINPADAGSRGILPKDIINHDLWWSGPHWLKSDPSTWESKLVIPPPLEAVLTSGIREEDLKLKDKKEVSMPVNTTNSLPRPVIDINRYSSFIRLMRVTAFIRRVVTKKYLFTPLTVDELHKAETWWFKKVQSEMFSEVIAVLKKGKQLSNKHYLKPLNPFLDSEGLLRFIELAIKSRLNSDKLIRPSANTFETLLECKKIRESLGGENHHIDQCNKIPENLGEIEYFYHRKCFQKFVYAKTLLKQKTSQDSCQGSNSKLQKLTRKTSQRQSDEATGSRGLFPNICMICKKKELRVKSVCQSLSRIVTDTAERTLKEAAIAHNDLEMMTAVTETDLKAKEFQKHEKCYLDYTRVVRKTAESTEGGNDDKQSGDYNVVLSLVDSDIIGGQQCLSMETLMTRYCGNIGTRQSRHKLKERLTKSFGDQIVFLQAEYHISQVVISKECLHNQMISGSSTRIQQSALKREAS